MSFPTSRAKAGALLALVLVLVATILAPAADAEDRGTLTTTMTLDQGVITAGTNDLLDWRVTTSCMSDAADCGNVMIQDVVPAGLTVLTVDTSLAVGYAASIDQFEGLAGPSTITLTRANNIIDGEAVTIVIRTQVGPDAAPLSGSFEHVATTTSTNATPPTTSNSVPVQWLNTASWRVEQGPAVGDPAPVLTVGVNQTHRVAVCGPTTANVVRSVSQLDLVLPAGVVIVESDGAALSESGLAWTTPEITQSMLGEEHVADLGAGRSPEFCTEFFPIFRFPASMFSIADTVQLAAALTDPAVGGEPPLCAGPCRNDLATTLSAPATEIAAIVSGPPRFSIGGFQRWTVGLDATNASEPIVTPILETSIPVGLQIHEVVVPPSDTGIVTHSRIHLSIDGGTSFLPTPLDTATATDGSAFGRSDFDLVAGPGVPITAIQVRWYGESADVLDPGVAPTIEILTVGDPAIPVAESVATLCVVVAASNAASASGRGEACHLADALTSGLSGIGDVIAEPAAPTAEQLITVTADLPIENGQPLVDPMIFELLPVGFHFVRFENISTTVGLTPVPDPRVEVIENFAGTGRDLVRFDWGPHVDGTTTAHTVNWAAADMFAAGVIAPASIDVSFIVTSEPGTEAGLVSATAGIVADTLAECTPSSVAFDDVDGIRADRSGTVCSFDHFIETTSAASIDMVTWIRAEDELASLTHSSEPGVVCPVLRLNDRDHTAAPCAVHTVPNGQVDVRTEVQNTGNLPLSDHWVYALLPRSGDVEIDPALIAVPRDSDWNASLAGPVTVSGLGWEPVQPGDVIVEYSTSLDPCRFELDSGGAGLGCVQDWTPTPSQWSDVTAYRVNVPFDRVPFTGGATYVIEAALLVPADAAFSSSANLATGQAAFSTSDGMRLVELDPTTTIGVPSESDILSAGPDLLPHDLALSATLDIEASSDLADGVDGGDIATFQVTITNQGSPTGMVEFAVHGGDGLWFGEDATSGIATASDGTVMSWTRSMAAAGPEQFTVIGQLGRGSSVTVPVAVVVGTEWMGEPIEVIAEISNFDADGFPGGDVTSGELTDRDSTPDLDPDNDVQPAAPDAPGDDVITGDGQPDTGVEADPLADDEDDHDVAAVPLWDLAVDVGLQPDQSPMLSWDTLVAGWTVTVTNEGDRAAYAITADVSIPDGMSWLSFDGVIDGAAATSSSAALGAVDVSTFTIDQLAAGASVTLGFSTQVVNTQIAEFSAAVALRDFDADVDPANDPHLLAVDWDQASGDQAGSATVTLPIDVAVELRHTGTAGLPLAAGVTTVELDARVLNVGRAIDHVDVILSLPSALAHRLDPAASTVDSDGNPVMVTWDSSGPAKIRASLRRSDGEPLAHGTSVELPIELVATADAPGVDLASLVIDFAAAVPPATDGAAADIDPSNDKAQAAVRLVDLAVDIEVDESQRLVTTADGTLAARWVVTVRNEGTLDSSSVVIANLLPDGMALIGVGSIDGADGVAVTAGPHGATDDVVALTIDRLPAGETVSFEVLTRFLDSYEGRFQSHIEIVDFATPLDRGEPQSSSASDADSRSGSWFGGDDTDEDDDDKAELELPVDVAIEAVHTGTSGSEFVPGSTQITFDVDVTNAGRPLREFALDLVANPSAFAPFDTSAPALVLADDGDGDVLSAVWTPTETGARLAVVGVNETLGGGDPTVIRRDLDPGETVTVPLALTLASDWSGEPLTFELMLADPVTDQTAVVTATAPMWDLALSVDRGFDQSPYLDLSSASATWAITVTNEGNQPAYDIAIAHAIPAGMTLERFDGVSTGTAVVETSAAEGATGLAFFEIDALDPGDHVTFDVRTRAATPDRSTYTATAEIAGFDDDAEPANAANPFAFDADSTPDLAVGDAAARRFAMFDPTTDTADLIAAVAHAASVVVDEDDRDQAQVSVPTDVGLDLSVDADATVLPTVAGSIVSFELEIANQGASIRSMGAEIRPDVAMWSLFDLDLNPSAATTGDAAISFEWSDDAANPVVLLDGELSPGQVVRVPIILTVAPGASASFGALALTSTVISIDDDGDVGTVGPELIDADGDATAAIELDVLDLAATIELDPSTQQPVTSDSTVTFSLTIMNQGTVAATEISLVSVLDETRWLPLNLDQNVPAVTLGGAQLGYAWDANAAVTLDGSLPPGATANLPLTLTLAPDADLGTTTASIEISAAIAVDGSSLVDFDSTADVDPDNDAQPAAPGDETDGVTNNLNGDEDDHDIAGLASLAYSLGNEVWFDLDDDGTADAGEPRAVGVLVELFADANGDGRPDDRDLSDTITNDDRIAVATTDADGLYLFSDVAVGSYVIVIPSSQFARGAVLEGWSAGANLGADPNDGVDGDNNAGWAVDEIRTITVRVGGGAPEDEAPNNDTSVDDRQSDLTIDLGLSRFSIGNQLWFDESENGIRQPFEPPVVGALVNLFADANGDGLPDDRSGDGRLTRADALQSMRTDTAGQYLFTGIGPGVYLVGVDATNWDRGVLKGWQRSPFHHRTPGYEGDDDNDGRVWIDGTLVSYPFTLGDGEPLGETSDNDPLTPDGNENLTIDFGFEVQPVLPFVWPEFDTTGFTNTNQWDDPVRGFGNAPVPLTGGFDNPEGASNDEPTFTGPDGAFGDPFESLDIFDESGEGPPVSDNAGAESPETDDGDGDGDRGEEAAEEEDLGGDSNETDADADSSSTTNSDSADADGPLAYSGNNARELASWAAMLIVLGAALVGATREED